MSTATRYTYHPSPLGELLLTSDGEALTMLYLPPIREGWPDPRWQRDDSLPLFEKVRQQLDEYFQGERVEFDLPLRPSGTPFQAVVWKELEKIPFGETISYGELARRIGSPAASRAVGLANGKNPLPIVLPCHRVIGANRSLTGYGGGLPRKLALLKWEGEVKSRGPRPLQQVSDGEAIPPSTRLDSRSGVLPL